MESKNFIIIEFLEILISKNECKMILMIITKNNAADPEKGFLIKSISKPYGRATAMPPAWELILTERCSVCSANFTQFQALCLLVGILLISKRRSFDGLNEHLSYTRGDNF